MKSEIKSTGKWILKQITSKPKFTMKSQSSHLWEGRNEIYGFTQPLSPQSECDTRSVFKWSLNSVFFPLDWLPYQVNEPYNLPISGGRIVGCISFPSILMGNAFELGMQCPFPMMINVTSCMPL